MLIESDRIVKCPGCITYLELLDIDTGVVGETLGICYLNVCFLQLISQVIPHLREWEKGGRKRKHSEQ